MTQVEEYKKNMSELFSHWKRKKSEDGSINYSEQFFIEDGVIYPKQWFSQDIRPLYLLKEAHGWDKSGSLIDDHLMNTGKNYIGFGAMYVNGQKEFLRLQKIIYQSIMKLSMRIMEMIY